MRLQPSLRLPVLGVARVEASDVADQRRSQRVTGGQCLLLRLDPPLTVTVRW